VNPFFLGIRYTLWPGADAKHGPLPPLLIGLTVVTGLVDAFSYLMLGHVFVANMTGNVLFLAFALAGIHGFSIPASAVALVAFMAGAFTGGAVGVRLGLHRGRLLVASAVAEALCFAAGVVLAAVTPQPMPASFRYPLIVLLAIAMGIQNATARRLAVPDLTTTVLTLTITGFAADSAMADGRGSSAGRRFTSVAAIFVGALLGAMLILHAAIALPLAAALLALVAVAFLTHAAGMRNAQWVHP
jgi:uncharacterized membrane protein YoaK (UPF0700 family)